MSSVFEELAARMDFQAVFSEYLRLKKKGHRYFAACPFHQEKDPSLSVDITTGLWHCFGCKEGGNIFQFIAKIEQLEMSEVVAMLAQRYGVDLRKYQPEAERQRLTRRQLLLRIVKAAAAFYRQQLTTTSHGQEALAYLRRRGLSEATITRFGLGVTPREPDGLTRFLQEHNARARDLVELNLSLEARRGELIDMLRQRIIFPLFDARGEVLSFAGRALGEGEPKYLNTANTPVYNKSRLLYGLNFARKAISSEECALIVEGYMDVISLHQAGVVNAVATCGTALTREHIQTLSRHTDRFFLAFDGDAAGIAAALRSCEEFLAAGHYPRVLVFPEGQDPDDVARRGGAEAINRLRDRAVPYPRLLTGVRIKSADPDPLEVKRLLKEVLPVFGRIRDAQVQDAFVRDLAAALKLREQQARDTLLAALRAARGGRQAPETTGTPRERFLQRFFAAALKDARLRSAAAQELSAEDFPAGCYRELFTRLIAQGEDCAAPQFPAELAKLCAQLQQALLPAGEYAPAAYFAKLRGFKLEDVNERIRALRKELAQAKDAGDSERAGKLSAQMQRLLAERAALTQAAKPASRPDTPHP